MKRINVISVVMTFERDKQMLVSFFCGISPICIRAVSTPTKRSKNIGLGGQGIFL